MDTKTQANTEAKTVKLDTKSETKTEDETDPERGIVECFDFTNKSIRRAFIRKVYGILFLQLIFTLGIVLLFVYCLPVKTWLRAHTEIFWASLGAALFMMFCMACCPIVRRQTPHNFVCLAFFTVALSFVFAFGAIRFNPFYVLLSVGITAGVCLAVSLFALVINWDLTLLRGSLGIFVIILLFFGLVVMFFPTQILSTVYCSFGVFLFCVYLMYNTQLMMGGNHRFAISPEEYVFAALNLYVDIMLVFVIVLELVTPIKAAFV